MSAITHGRLPAVFMRGGTSKALMFHARDLPADRSHWHAIFLAALGSPDPYGRQLDGMGGGVTSVSKVCVIGPPSRDDADVDYSFFQIVPREGRVLEHGNCGNMSSAVGPFAVDEGLVPAQGDRAVVRVHNTNTRKIIRSTFALDPATGRAAVDGDLVIPGVAGSGSPVQLDFLDPGGARTGQLLPSGHAIETFEADVVGRVEVSLVDAANPCVFLAAASVGLQGSESPLVLEADEPLIRRLHAIGAQAAVVFGLTAAAGAGAKTLPLIGLVSAPTDSTTLAGEAIAAADCDLVVRMLSSGQPHRALPVTGAICTAVAMQVPGTVPHRLARHGPGRRRIAMPSGLLQVDAAVETLAGGAGATGVMVHSGSLLRTARRLFDGHVYF